MKNWTKKTPVKLYSEYDDVQEKLAKINGIDDLDRFLNPRESDLHDPRLLDNIEQACKIILDAMRTGKKIRIFSDIDADGITATVVMYNFLKQFGVDVSYFHVQRSAGHGIEQAMDVVPEDTELLIIVDSSTSSAEACRELKEKGIEIIILDHHHPECENPYALIVNNQMCDYPNKELSGVGIVWKTVQVLDDYLGSGTADEFIDLVAVGLHGDVMSMREPENRYIVYQGLKNIKNEGLKAILQANKINLFDVNSGTIGFTITPTLNGASRMDKIELALKLLSTDDYFLCANLAAEAKELNDRRKLMQADFVKRYSEKIEHELQHRNIIVLVDDTITSGFTGLVAGDIANKYRKPTVVLTHAKTKDGEPLFRGSARGYGFNIRGHISQMPQALFAAGHDQACGVGVLQKNFEEFVKHIGVGVNLEDKGNQYDLELDVQDITYDLIEKVMEFNFVTGKGMRETKFLVRNLVVVGKRQMGGGSTVRIDCNDEKNPFVLMKFRTNQEFFDSVQDCAESIVAVGSLNLNKWKGKWKTIITPQLFLDDYEVVS